MSATHLTSHLRMEYYEQWPQDAFSRLDETEDAVFYSRDRFVSHLDTLALSTVERLVGTLVVEEKPVVLDLMASWDSHLPATLEPGRVVGLGLNENELKANDALDEYVVHDLNLDPRLPFDDEAFDVVVNTVSVDYMTRPIEVFLETARVLKPGGLHLVIFSNRLFPPKAVRLWREASEEERVLLVEEFFRQTGAFGETSLFVSKGKPRPKDDKYAHTGVPSDPVYAVYADKKGGSASKRRPAPRLEGPLMPSREEVERRKKESRRTLRCPYCDGKMRKWAVPQSPFTEWDNEFMYICFNDECPYLLQGWEVMRAQGNTGISYRQMYNPDRRTFMPVPVPSLEALRDSIVD